MTANLKRDGQTWLLLQCCSGTNRLSLGADATFSNIRRTLAGLNTQLGSPEKFDAVRSRARTQGYSVKNMATRRIAMMTTTLLFSSVRRSWTKCSLGTKTSRCHRWEADGNAAGALTQTTASEAVKSKATKAQRWQATCSAALTTLGYSEKLVELTIQTLMEQGSQMEASDVVASLQMVLAVVTGVPNPAPSVAGGVGSTQLASPASPMSISHQEERLMVALASFQGALPRPVTLQQALGAALLLPRVLLLEQQFTRDRLDRLRQSFHLEEAVLAEECCRCVLLSYSHLSLASVAHSLCASLVPCFLVCCRHPELLLAPFEALESKMTVMKNIMGVTGLPAVQMLTRFMFFNL
ncbi:hypothetical protein QJQ45_015324 [Haematococcus lacustris]|nr:hypothetical protein QJQ45_015324 [Haematococcus lacustris]